MELITAFNEKLKEQVDEDSFEWLQILFSAPEQMEVVAGLRESLAVPEELTGLLSTYGAFQSSGFGDAWQTVKLMSASELSSQPMGIVEFIDYYWGGRPEFADYFTDEQIAALNRYYKVCGLRYVDDNVHDYWFFNKQGHFGNLYFDQDDCEPALDDLSQLLDFSSLTLSLEAVLQEQLEEILDSV